MNYYYHCPQRVGDLSHDIRSHVAQSALWIWPDTVGSWSLGRIFPCLWGDKGEQENAWVSQVQLKAYFSDSGDFCYHGNLFSDIKDLISDVDLIPRQHKVIMTSLSSFAAVDNVGLSFPSYHTFNSLLAFASPQFINVYLVRRVVQCVHCWVLCAYPVCFKWCLMIALASMLHTTLCTRWSETIYLLPEWHPLGS